MNPYTKNCLSLSFNCVAVQSMASYHSRKESDYESYLSNLLWCRCPQIFSRCHNCKTTGGIEPSYQRSAFPPLTIQFLNSSNGFSTMIAIMSAWNPQVNTEFLSLIFWKMISMLSLPILNG